MSSEVMEVYENYSFVIYSKKNILFGLFQVKDSPINGVLIDGNGWHTEYKNGLKDGTQKFFYKNQQLKIYAEFKNGRRHGKNIHYHQNGKLLLKRIYKNGEQIGKTISWDENGNETVPKIGW